jgi:hypothetical protein
VLILIILSFLFFPIIFYFFFPLFVFFRLLFSFFNLLFWFFFPVWFLPSFVLILLYFVWFLPSFVLVLLRFVWFLTSFVLIVFGLKSTYRFSLISYLDFFFEFAKFQNIQIHIYFKFFRFYFQYKTFIN